MLQQLERLDQGSVVIAPAWYLDKSGNRFSNRDIYPLITEAVRFPSSLHPRQIYGIRCAGRKSKQWPNSGTIRSFAGDQDSGKVEHTGDSRGGEKQSESVCIRCASASPFRIPETRLPEGSCLLFKTFSFYETYKTLVWTVAGTFAVFSIMIIALLLAVRRLRCAKADLKHSRENLLITLNSIGDAVISTDTQCRIVNMNPVAEKLTGWKLKEAKGQRIPETLTLLNAENRQPWDCPALEVLRSGEPTMWARGTLISLNKPNIRFPCQDLPFATGTATAPGPFLYSGTCRKNMPFKNDSNRARKWMQSDNWPAALLTISTIHLAVLWEPQSWPNSN